MPLSSSNTRAECQLAVFAGSFAFEDPHVKGIVQRDLTGVESRLKRSALMNYLVAIVFFFNLKGHSYERSKKPVSAS
jgi:hypothetical protein